MKSVLIRANAEKKLGMGHLNRCLIIANYLEKEKGIKSIFLLNEDEATRNYIQAREVSHEVIFFDSQISKEKEARLINLYAETYKVNTIILDLLEFELTTTFLAILKIAKRPICSIIDDSDFHEVNTDLILNGNPNQLKYNYKNSPGIYLLGPQYFIMDTEYSYLKASKKEPNGKVLITLGGSDHNDLLFKLLNALDGNEYLKEILVVSSRATGYIPKLKKHIAEMTTLTTLKIDEKGLSHLWSDCEFAITAGGNTLFERIASGTPGATICQLPRQDEIASQFMSLGVNTNFGYGPSLTMDTIKSMVKSFIDNSNERSQQRQKCRSIIDGKGLIYFAEELLKL